jgi:hypothetical protein
MILIVPALLFSTCKKDEPSTILQNDCLKRSVGPNVVGLDIEFVYAMALPPSAGKLVSAQVEASIAGAGETWMENKSYHTNTSGVDVGVPVGSPSVNSGNRTEVSFTADTCAAALRYYYRISEEARGKEVSFIFTAKASNGEQVSYQMGPYTVAKMDIKLDLNTSNNDRCYISIADMAVYTAAEVSDPAKVDLIYFYDARGAFLHSLIAPTAPAEYRPGVFVPSGAANHTPIRKVWNLRDRHLARAQYGVYVDDIDFEQLDLTGMPDWALNLKAEAGAWIQTADGRYRAYIYINSVDNGAQTARISMKRYTLK